MKSHQWHVRGSDSTASGLEVIIRDTDATNSAEAFRRAVTAYSHLLEQKRRGADIIIQRRGKRPALWEAL